MAKLAKKHRGRKPARGTGMSLVELMEMFPTEWDAECWFERLRWGKHHHITCPRCLAWNVLETPNREPMPYWCGKCRRHFSVRIDTAMHGTKLSYRTWALAIHAFAAHSKGVSSVQMHRDLGICQKSAWFLNHRIREAFREELGEEDEDPVTFKGPIEVDETWIGGKNSLLYVVQTGTLTPRMGVSLVLVAFVATVIGGMGSLVGAALGGLVVGVLTVLLQAVLTVELRPYRDAFVFAVLIEFLLLRPQGLLRGRGARERV